MNPRIEPDPSRLPLPIEIHATRSRPLGMPPARFLRDYWQKQPLLIRGAFADFENPVAPDDLAGLACEELALARIAIHEPKSDRWTLRNGPFVESDFATLPKTHWTLLVQDVDKWDADVAALLAAFDFLPSWRVDDVMVSYAEDGGSVGAHVDQYDVFLLQGFGRRHWQIDENPDAPKAFREDAELKLLREFTPTHDWILEPGDMLYLPPGVPHHGVACGACMTYSIGMRAPSQAELIGDFVDHLIEAMPDDARYRDADLMPASSAGEIDAAAIARVMQAMPWLRIAAQGSASGVDAGAGKAGRRVPALSVSAASAQSVGAGPIPASALRTWFGCFITRYRSAHAVAAHPRPLTDVAFARALTHGACVQRNPWSRFAWMREARGARLFVAGDSHACSLRLARLVCARTNFPLAGIGAARRAPQRKESSRNAAADRDHAVLRALIDAGHLAIQRRRRPRRAR